ncbi:transposase [Streptomyces pimonensis]|uniref:Transposase n=1 Tax=Streptomyces pimonensis TaxID=2860288 RepID=A0ABV4IX23_9ACTN
MRPRAGGSRLRPRQGPLAFVVTGGNSNDCTRFTTVMERVRVPRTGPGRPLTRPDHILSGKGYHSKAIRAWLRRRAYRTQSPSVPTKRPSPSPHS